MRGHSLQSGFTADSGGRARLENGTPCSKKGWREAGGAPKRVERLGGAAAMREGFDVDEAAGGVDGARLLARCVVDDDERPGAGWA